MDNHAAIFAVPADLKTDVEERLVYLRRGQVGDLILSHLIFMDFNFCTDNVADIEPPDIITFVNQLSDIGHVTDVKSGSTLVLLRCV